MTVFSKHIYSFAHMKSKMHFMAFWSPNSEPEKLEDSKVLWLKHFVLILKERKLQDV